MALELALPGEVIALSAQTADTLLRSGSGDGALLYLWLLRHGGDTPLDKARHAFGWDGVRLEAAQAVLTGLGLAKAAQPAPPPRPEPQSPPEYTAADLTRELDNAASPFPGLVAEVQRRLGKILSTSDLRSLYTLYDYLGLPAEVICLLVSWCVEEFCRKYGEGRLPRMSQIQKEGFIWSRQGVDTTEAAEQHLQRLALLRGREGEILRLLDQKPRPLVKQEQQWVAAWTDMGFGDDALRLAYEKTILKKQSMDWKYMNGILCGWHKKNLHTLAEIEAGDRPSRRPTGAPPAPGGAGAPGEAGQRVREDMERMREYMRRQRETEGG